MQPYVLPSRGRTTASRAVRRYCCAQRRLDLGGAPELLVHALGHLGAQRTGARVETRLVDGEQLAAAQDPAAVDHDVGHRHAVLAVDELVDRRR